MRRYEMVVIADPTMTEAVNDEHVTQLEQLIGQGGGTVHKVDCWGKLKLAYPIKNFNEGHYTLLLYDGEPAIVDELMRRIKLSDAFLRALSIRADDEKAPTEEEKTALLEARKEHLRRAEERAAAAEKPPEEVPAAAAPTKPAAEPVAEPAAEPVAEPVAEPAAEPASEPVAEPAVSNEGEKQGEGQ